MEDRKVDTHPSYGMMAINRITGTRRNLFGSALKEHGTTMRLVIKQGHRTHSSGLDNHYGTSQPIIEVEMSTSQFTQLITSMNMGDGVPCTILSTQGKRVEQAPEIETEFDRVRSSFGKKIKAISQKMEDHAAKIDSILNKKTVSAADRKEIKGIFSNFILEIESNIPFILELFEESADKVVSHSKQEVEGFINQMVAITGIRSIKNQFSNKEEHPILEAHSEEKTSIEG